MTTLLAVCNAVAEELGPFIPFAATSTDASSDALRTVISSSLVNDNLTTSSYGGRYLYAVDGALLGAQRQIRTAGFTTASGALAVSQVFAAIPQSGVNWEMTHPLPRTTYQGVRGIKELANLALRKLWVPRRYPFTGVANQLQYSLAGAWWLDDTRRALRLMDPPSVTAGNPIPSWRSWSIRLNAEVPFLEISGAYGTGDLFYLVVNSPANSRLKLSGTWAEQSNPRAGLVLDADESYVDLNLWVECTLYECYAYMATRQDMSQEKEHWAGLAAEQLQLIGRKKLWGMRREAQPLDGGQAADLTPYWSKSWVP